MPIIFFSSGFLTIQASLPHANTGLTELLYLLSLECFHINEGLNMNSSIFRDATPHSSEETQRLIGECNFEVKEQSKQGTSNK